MDNEISSNGKSAPMAIEKNKNSADRFGATSQHCLFTAKMGQMG